MIGSAQKALTIVGFKNLKISIPPVEEQMKIVDILSSLDNKIKNNNKTNQTLEEIAQALFKSWFIDFEPVKAKMQAKADGKDPQIAAMRAISGNSEEVLQQLTQEKRDELANITDLFPDKLVESELGMIPDGWNIDNVESYFEVNPQRRLKKGTNAAFLDMKNMPTSGHLANKIILKEVTSGIKYKNDDTLIARITPCLQNGKTAFVDFLDKNEVGWGSTEYIVLRSKGNISKYVSYLLARYQPFKDYCIQSMTGSSGRQRANAQMIKEYPICFPPENEIHNNFDKIISSLFRKIKNNGDQNKNLVETRDTLLPKLLSAQICLNIED